MAYQCKLIQCYPGFGPELTTDGNMEDDPTTNWPGTGANVAEETASVHAGCLALEVTATAAPGSARQSITVEAGERYRIGVWGLCDAATDRWRMTIYATTVRWTSDWHTNDTDWEEEVRFYRVPDGIAAIEVRLEVDQIGDVVFFDDVSVRREAPVPMAEIDLQYNVGGLSLLDRGVVVGRPERVSLYGGRLQLELVRQDDGKRIIPLKLLAEATDGEALIDRVNALEEMLRHATRYRKDGWGGEVFLELKIDDATYSNWFPVHEGEIDTGNLYDLCNEPNDTIDDLPVWLTCEPYWEADVTYDLSNLLDNPGFEEWNDGICNSEPDCWDDYSTAGGSGENRQEVDTAEEGCEALRVTMAVGVAAGAYQGVTQDITARLRADTEYTLLAWVQNTDAFVNCVAQVYAEGQNSGVTFALNSAIAHAEYTLVECQFTPNATDIANWVEIRLRILTNDVNATGLVHFDKMLVMEASNVPTGWKGPDYLINHYDRTAGHINFTSVCDIPGEVDAELKLTIPVDETTQYMRIAKRTRDTPCAFIWQLIPCEAYTEAEGGAGGACAPGLIDAAMDDSDKIIDANAPSGSHVAVDFAGDQNMVRRCYWDITADLATYYGKFAVVVLAKVDNLTDVVTMEVTMAEDPSTQGGVITQTATTAAGVGWNVMDGWTKFSFRIGTHDNDLFGVGNNWRLYIWAANDPADGVASTLQIAGAYLIPLDESYLVAGSTAGFAGGVSEMIIKDMDGDRGLFAHGTVSDTYYANIGAVGTYPRLTPGVENWLYFMTNDPLEIADTFSVSLKYRPRGIFLRGANP